MSDETSGGITILVVTDPGLPLRRMLAIREDLERRLAERVDGPATVHVRSELIETRTDGSLRLASAARLRREHDGAEITLVLTEMPRHAQGRLLVAEAFPEHRLAALFWPTLWSLSPRRRILDIMVESVEHLGEGLIPARGRMPTRRSTSPGAPVWERDAARGVIALRARPVIGQVRTVLGMVVTNAPWATVRKLSSALAAASAAGAFGIFYSSIWQMSAALSTPRLLLIGLLAMTLMVGWLVVGNRLWDRPVHEDGGGPAALYNVSTLLTLFLCVLALYVALVVLILLAGLVVIAPSFMAQVLGEPATFSHYMGVAWLSAALGVVAGGLGASFDSETDLRQLTHASRERQRERSEDGPDDRAEREDRDEREDAAG
ncbi:hypothetical protein BF93_11795 [Brachybacterium phenoliresistens]|uniref:DUF2267 domain-containing protein n=1 Tax=Brachybacterium phenoliresistens TaxID=396014 RepID=Z9JV87_9MICO|nr:hypothetical protein [Brachybacterium phenoliresistens]EWS82295.1 hypothetical protein BF93_11795 [Brachybacterium phenoliresistens]